MALSVLDLPGGFILSYLAKTANYTIGLFDGTIDVTANSVTITLPTAVGVAGRTYVIKNSGDGIVTVDGHASETIDGLFTVALVPGESITLQSTGSGWIIN